MAFLFETRARGDEFIWRGRIEFKHVVVAGNDAARADIVGEFCGLGAIEISGDASLRFVAVDRKQSEIDLETAE